jgi:hypothetical protein
VTPFEELNDASKQLTRAGAEAESDNIAAPLQAVGVRRRGRAHYNFGFYVLHGKIVGRTFCATPTCLFALTLERQEWTTFQQINASGLEAWLASLRDATLCRTARSVVTR